MLTRLASHGSFGWLFAGGLAGLAALALIAPCEAPAPKRVAKPLCIHRVAPGCEAIDEAVRATAVIHYFDNEIDYATAPDPASAKAAALLALPMPCTRSSYSYPALSRHIESAAHVHLMRGDKRTAWQLLQVGRAYGVDARMLDSLELAIVR